MKRLQRKLNAGLGFILASGFVVQWGLGSSLTDYIAEEQMLTRLYHDIETIRNALSFDSHGQLVLDGGRQAPVYLQTDSGRYYGILSGAQRVLSPSLGQSTFPFLALKPTEIKRDYGGGPARQELLILAKGFAIEDREVTIAVSEDLSPLRQNIRDMGSLFLILNGLIIPLALMAQWMFVRRALKPFMLLRKELSTMVKGTAYPAELGLPVMDEIHKLMQIVDRRLERSRNALSNLAHGLKTPLAVIYQLAESPEIQKCPELQTALKTHSSSIYRLVEQELKRARMAGAGMTDKVFNPADDLGILIDVLRAVYPDKSLHYDIQAPARIMVFDRQDILELLGNLLDNASKWAKSRVSLKILDHDGLQIIVEDDGNGCSDGELKHLGQRGVRLDETKAGHGIGLSIVHDLVKLYGGELSFTRSRTWGGLAVTIWFPDITRHD